MQVRPKYYLTIIGQGYVSVKVFKKYLNSAFPRGKSAGWQCKEIDFCLLWVKQLTSYVKAIVEMECRFCWNVVSK